MKNNKNTKKKNSITQSNNSSKDVKQQQIDLQTLNEMFQRSFPENTIASIYSESSNNLQASIERLLSLQDSSRKSTSTIKQNEKNKKNKKELIFEEFVKEFRALLTEEELNNVWKDAEKRNWKNNSCLEELATVAQECARDAITAKFDGVQDDSSPSSSTKNFSYFVDLFYGLIPQDKLDVIWKNVESSSSNEEERVEIATLYALQYIEEKEAQIKNPSTSTFQGNNNNSLKTYLINQERSRLQISTTAPAAPVSSSSSSLSSYSISSKAKTSSKREVAMRYLLDIFAETSLTQEQILNELINCHDHAGLAMEALCEVALRSQSLARTLTYSEAVFTNSMPNPPRSSSTSPLPDAPLPPRPPPPTSANPWKTGSLSVSVPASISAKQIPSVPASTSPLTKIKYPSFYSDYHAPHENQVKLVRYFASTFRKNNPHTFIKINSRHEFVFDYSEEETLFLQKSSQRECNGSIFRLAIDFHGLPVHHSLEIVGSCLDFYLNPSSLSLLADCRELRKILLVLVVGRGRHSPGGVPKLGPAVCKFLREHYSDCDWVAYEGEVTVTIPFRCK
jgi:hypothetical protein